MTDIDRKIREAKKRLLRMHFESNVGHIGGNLSALDAMMVLHHEVMGADDAFVLSKGHAAGALYVTLWSRGLLNDADLRTFHRDGTRLAGHPAPGWCAQIPIATGSLGHGFPVANGIAMAWKDRGRDGQVFCLTSDGEWQEGSTWEALIFLAHRRLGNLTVLVDVNGLQGFGSTQAVASMGNLKDKIAAFGVEVVEIDGHAPEQIRETLTGHPGAIVLLRTVKGAGVSFMENRMEWHYLPMNREQYEMALREIESA